MMPLTCIVSSVDQEVAAGTKPIRRLTFEVVLTAPAHRDVPLTVCPDYLIRLGGGDNLTTASYALSCAGAPHRDAAGRPTSPAGVPVRFAMAIDAPRSPDNAAKLVWQLDAVGSVVAGGVVAVR